MIINNLYIVRIAVMPAKADSPLIVNANAILSFSIPNKFFQTIRWWYSQVLQELRSLENFQLHSCFTLDIIYYEEAGGKTDG